MPFHGQPASLKAMLNLTTLLTSLRTFILVTVSPSALTSATYSTTSITRALGAIYSAAMQSPLSLTAGNS